MVVDGLNGLDAAQAQAYLEMSLRLTPLEQGQVQAVLQHDALKEDVRLKTNWLVTKMANAEQARLRSPRSPFAPAAIAAAASRTAFALAAALAAALASTLAPVPVSTTFASAPRRMHRRQRRPV